MLMRYKDQNRLTIGTNGTRKHFAPYLAEIDGPRWHLNLSPGIQMGRPTEVPRSASSA
jgi:hypothetical protein